MDFKNIHPKTNLEDVDDTFNITGSIISQIVKEEDERTMLMIEEYIKSKQAEGEIIAAKFIPEGKLRHIINLGLTRYAAQEHIDLKPADMFPQEQYIEFLRRELMLSQQTVHNLQKQVEMLQKISGMISTETNIGGIESEEI